MVISRWVKKIYGFLLGSTDNWREQIFSVLTRTALIVVVPAAMLPILVSIFNSEFRNTDFLILFFVVGLLLTFNKKFPFRFRVILALGVIFFWAVFLIWRDGFLGSGSIFLIFFILISGLLLGARASLIALGMEAVVLILIGLFIRFETLPVDWVENYSLSVWGLHSFTLLLISCGTAFITTFLVKFLENARLDAEKFSEDLIKTNQQLRKEIKERIDAEQKSEKSQQQLISMFNNFSEPLYVCDPFTYQIKFANAVLQNMIKEHTAKKVIIGELCYQTIHGLNAPCSFCTNEIILSQAGPHVWEHYNRVFNRHYMITDRIIDWPDDTKMRMGVAVDITERKLAEEQLRHDSLHDNLTGLANRKLLLQRIEHAVACARRNPECKVAVLFFDFDNFKLINDTYGHSCGDNLLIEIAGRLSSIVREVDLVSRLGGDEFVILLEDFFPQGTLFMIADRVMAALRQPFIIEGQEIVTTASVGIVSEIKEGVSAEDIIRDADIAMYQAKEHGRNKYVIFREDMRQAIFARSVVEQNLRRGIVLREFEVYYQPIINTKTAQIAGFEALIRWNHPSQGVLLPKDFWKDAEEMDLTIDIGKLVIQNAVRQVKVWQEKFCSPDEKYKLNINFSSKQFLDNQLMMYLTNTITDYDFDPLILNIEVNEVMVMEQILTISDRLKAFRKVGVQLHLDDFGKAFQSLEELKKLSFDTIKIDREFVSGVHLLEDGSSMIESIINTARALKIKTIAEGVENQNQLNELTALGCDYWQGYLFSKPLPAQEIEKMIQPSQNNIN